MYLFQYLAMLSVVAVVVAVVVIVTMKRAPADQSTTALVQRWLPRLVVMAAVFVAARTLSDMVEAMAPVMAVMPFIIVASLAASVVAFSGGLVVDALVAVALAVLMAVIGIVNAVIDNAHIAASLKAVVGPEDQAMLLEMAQRQISQDLFFGLGSAALALIFGVVAVVVARNRAAR